MHLTGPPRLKGTTLPRPDLGAAMEVSWADESIVETLRGGVRRVLETRLRGRLSFGWRYLAPDTAALILGELQAPAVTLTPRTRGSSDPDWAEEVTFAVRVTSDLPSVAQLASGTVAFVVEMETLATYAAVPGSVYGGFYSEAVEGGYEITPYGEATLTDGDDYSFPFLGVTYTVPTHVVGPPAIAALRTRPHPDYPGLIIIDTSPAP